MTTIRTREAMESGALLCFFSGKCRVNHRIFAAGPSSAFILYFVLMFYIFFNLTFNIV